MHYSVIQQVGTTLPIIGTPAADFWKCVGLRGRKETRGQKNTPHRLKPFSELIILAATGGPLKSQSGFFVVASESASTTTSTFAPGLRWACSPFSSVTTFVDANLPVQIVRFLNTDLCLLWYGWKGGFDDFLDRATQLALLLAHGGNLQQGKYNAKFYVTVGPQSSAKYTMYGIAREPSGFVALIGP